MINSKSRMLAGAAFLLGAALPAQAADYIPPIVEAPPQIIYEEVSYGGWYLRGDIDYHWSDWTGGDYITYGCCTVDPGTDDFDTAKLKGAFSIGAGVGYQINRYLRTDFTADYWFRSDFEGTTSGFCGPGGAIPCSSRDTSSFSALMMLANAYVDLGTYNRVTPYVGAGIGGAYVKWGDLRNRIDDFDIDDRHDGVSGMRFAWVLMAGASYCLTNNLKADVGYRFSRISGGRMFEYVDSSGGGPGAGPGFHDAINTHEVRAGLRYQLGAGDNCATPVAVAYEPEPVALPVYK